MRDKTEKIFGKPQKRKLSPALKCGIILNGKSFRLFLISMLSKTYLFLSFIVFSVAVLTVFYGAQAVFPDYIIKYAAGVQFLIPILSVLCAAMLFIFSRGLKYYRKAYILNLCENFRRGPKYFLSFGKVLRFCKFSCIVFIKKCSLAALIFLPSGISLFAVYGFYKNGVFSSSALTAEILFCAVLLISSFMCYFYITGAYFSAFYLMYQNPLLKSKTGVENAAVLTSDNLVYIACFRLKILKYYLLRFLLPFSMQVYAFPDTLSGLFCRNLFEQTENLPDNGSPVVFYIDRRTQIKTDKREII